MVFAAAVLVSACYTLWVGPIAFMGDSYLLADRAKHLIWDGTLNLNNHGSIVYPPLYPVITAFVYRCFAPQNIFLALTILNSVLVASTVFPLQRILAVHCHLRGRSHIGFTLLVATSPTLLAYAPMVLTESLFLPLLCWTVWLFLEAESRPSFVNYALCGLSMAACALTRTAALGILLGIAACWSLQLFDRRDERIRRLLGTILGLAIPVIILVLWGMFERHFVSMQGKTSYSSIAELTATLHDATAARIRLGWTWSGVVYFAFASLTAAGPLFLGLVLTRPKALIRGSLELLTLLLISMAIASIVLIAPIHYGGVSLTWNRYFAPFVGLLTITVLLRRASITTTTIIIAAVLMCGLALLGNPAALGCHFPDSLTAFTTAPGVVAMPAAGKTALLLLFGLSSIPLFLELRTRYYAVGVSSAILATCFSLWACAQYWRHSGVLNLRNYQGIGTQLIALASAATAPIRYDASIATGQSPAALRALFVCPFLLTPSNSVLLRSSEDRTPHFLLTQQTIPGAEQLGSDEDGLKLYRMPPDRTRGNLQPYTLQLANGFGPRETGADANGHPCQVRWVEPRATFILDLTADATGTIIQLNAANAGSIQELRLNVNGTDVPETVLVDRTLWSNGITIATFRAPLHRGRNELRIESVRPPTTLPGGRIVGFLLVDDPELFAP